jgi:hypothetical protein
MAQRRASGIAVASAGLAALALNGGIMAVGGFMAMPTSVCAAALSSWLMWSCVRPRSEAESDTTATSAGRCLGLGCLLGGLNAYPSFLLTAFFIGEVRWINDLAVIMLMVTVAGIFVGVPLGLLFSALYVMPLRQALTLARGGSMDSADHMARYAGVWLLCMALGAFGFGAVIGVGTCGEAFSPHRDIPLMVPLVLSCAPAFVTGLVLILVARQRLRARRSWLDRVLGGREPGWDVLPLEEMNEIDDSVRPLLRERWTPTHVLVRVRPAAGPGAYRSGRDVIPFALVALGAGRQLPATPV